MNLEWNQFKPHLWLFIIFGHSYFEIGKGRRGWEWIDNCGR